MARMLANNKAVGSRGSDAWSAVVLVLVSRMVALT
jgi:hypothetical protein